MRCTQQAVADLGCQAVALSLAVEQSSAVVFARPGDERIATRQGLIQKPIHEGNAMSGLSEMGTLPAKRLVGRGVLRTRQCEVDALKRSGGWHDFGERIDHRREIPLQHEWAHGCRNGLIIQGDAGRALVQRQLEADEGKAEVQVAQGNVRQRTGRRGGGQGKSPNAVDAEVVALARFEPQCRVIG